MAKDNESKSKICANRSGNLSLSDLNMGIFFLLVCNYNDRLYLAFGRQGGVSGIESALTQDGTEEEKKIFFYPSRFFWLVC